MIRAIVPLKLPDTAKSRLASVLSPAQRRDLYFLLARRTLAALARTPGISQVHVVTASREVAAFARIRGASVLEQPADQGTASAFVFALQSLPAEAAHSTLLIAADLPCISSVSLSALIDARMPEGVTIVPDRLRIGTNALLCAPRAKLTPLFGANSFQRHLDAARSGGIAARIWSCEALGFDLDTPQDLRELPEILLALMPLPKPLAENAAHPLPACAS